MTLLHKPSTATHLSLGYITLGALTLVWTAIWYHYLNQSDTPAGSPPYYWCIGFMLSGVVLLVIGLALGHIGRAARKAELPPEEVTSAEEKATMAAAARPVIAPMAPMTSAPGVAVAQAPALPPAPAAVPPVASPAGTPLVAGSRPQGR